MREVSKLKVVPAATDCQRAAHEELRTRLGQINATLYNDRSFEYAQSALVDIADLLDMQRCWWTPDAAYPYDCEPAKLFSQSRGWPEELIQIWRKYRIGLYSPAYIRSRFENMPFVSQPDLRERQHPCAGYIRSNQILRELGVRSMLHVPIHLPKGQVGLVNWAGIGDPREVRLLLPYIAGELLATGNLFMRSFAADRGDCDNQIEERARLTVREWDCLRMLAQGYREAEAAELLTISKSTLRFHIENVVRKFGCKNRTHAVAMAAQLGLISPVGN